MIGTQGVSAGPLDPGPENAGCFDGNVGDCVGEIEAMYAFVEDCTNGQDSDDPNTFDLCEFVHDSTIGFVQYCLAEPEPCTDHYRELCFTYFGAPCQQAVDCADEISGTGTATVCGQSRQQAQDCANDNPGSACEPAYVCADELSGTGTTTVCGQTRQEAQDCHAGAATSPCEPAIACAGELSGAGTTTVCGQARQGAQDCGGKAPASQCYPVWDCVDNNNPVIPCDPNPQHDLVTPEACQFGCNDIPVRFGAPGEPLPDLWLVTCFVPVPDPINGGGIGVPVPMLNDRSDCPNDWEGADEAVPLVEDEHAPSAGVVGPLGVTLSVGECEVVLTAQAYGFGANEEAQRVPCALPA